jgi:type I restriction enzyme, S subunit
MNNETLEKHFDLAFSAPNGVQKLRELILTFAMQGKLVPQDPNDQPASELLKAIELEKQRLVKEGKIKEPKSLPEIKLEEIPHELPRSWKWVRLGHLFRVTSGNSLTKSKMNEGSFPVYGGNGIAGYHNEFNTERPTIVIGRVGYYCGSVHLTPERAWITDNAFFTIYDEERLYQKFVIWLLKVTNLQTDASSTAQPVISGGKIYSIPVPLPPLEEQKRIVAKIDRLMAQCDELENLGGDRNQKRITIHTAAIDRLLAAQEDSDFSTAWDFIQQHFGELYSVKENVAELRKVILQLAVMGKLVPQDPNDEPASELLRAIGEERKRLVEEGKIKQPKPSSKIKVDEIPYGLPVSWKWCRVWDISQLITSGSRDWAKYYSTSGSIFVTMGNLSRGNYNLRMDNVRYVQPPMDGEGSRTKLEEHDLLISITGDVGNLGLIPKDFGDAYINQHTCLLRFMPTCRNRYFPELMRSPFAKFQFDAPQRGIKNSFRLGDVGEMIIPLPPLAEQHRIVTKIDRLMALCDELEKQIDAATDKRTELLNALMAQV